MDEAAFVAGVRRPADHRPEHPALWFGFRDDLLLVQQDGERAILPGWPAVARLGGDFEGRHYLGQVSDQAVYAVDLAGDGASDPPDGYAFEGLRTLYGRLSTQHFALAGRAVQIVNWDRTHRFCGRCGERTLPAEGERATRCPRCGLLNFPRLSPAIIVLVRRGEELLLARNATFRGGTFSVLAGFVEPGESLEEAVAREVQEEVGIEIADIRYFGSQPWPFPHSLMVGFTARYVSGELRPDGEEILEARWFHPTEVPRIPARMSIARWLIESALDEAGVPGQVE